MYKENNPLIAKMLLFFCKHKMSLISKCFRIFLGCDIYCDLKNADLILPHPYGIIIHSKSVLGKNITIMSHVVIGRKNNEDVAPRIEDDVYIGAGAKILGNIKIGRGAIIGANAVVTKDVPAYSTVVGANRIIKTVYSNRST